MSLSKPAFDFSKRPAIAKRGTIPKAVGGFSNAQINAWFTDCCVDVNGAVVHSGRGIIHIKYSGGHAPAPGFTQLRQDLENISVIMDTPVWDAVTHHLKIGVWRPEDALAAWNMVNAWHTNPTLQDITTKAFCRDSWAEYIARQPQCRIEIDAYNTGAFRCTMTGQTKPIRYFLMDEKMAATFVAQPPSYFWTCSDRQVHQAKLELAESIMQQFNFGLTTVERNGDAPPQVEEEIQELAPQFND